MTLNSITSALSILPVPTLIQTAATGTISLICADVFDMISNQENSSNVGRTAENLASLSTCILAWTAITTIWIVAKKQWPVWSHLALLAIFKPMFKASTNYMTLSIQERLNDPITDVARYAFAINIITTTALLYQQRSLLRAFHLTALAASSLYFYNKG